MHFEGFKKSSKASVFTSSPRGPTWVDQDMGPSCKEFKVSVSTKYFGLTSKVTTLVSLPQIIYLPTYPATPKYCLHDERPSALFFEPNYPRNVAKVRCFHASDEKLLHVGTS